MNRYDPAIGKVYAVLKREFAINRVPVVELIEAQTKDPFKVLVATMLSARTKDQTTAAAAKRLFSELHDLNDLDRLSADRLEKLIFPVGFYREKARHLKAWPSLIMARWNGGIPETVEELVEIPGVGRKTANLVVAVAFNKPAVCVDVHVHRIMNRLGYIVSKTPLETEMLLRKQFPVRFWTTFNSYFVSFGQHTCFPRNPACDRCPVYRFCARKGVAGRASIRTKKQKDGRN